MMICNVIVFKDENDIRLVDNILFIENLSPAASQRPPPFLRGEVIFISLWSIISSFLEERSKIYFC